MAAPLWLKITSEEQKEARRAVLEALSALIKVQSITSELSKLKNSKKTVMNDIATMLHGSMQELEKLKLALPQLELKIKAREIKEAKVKEVKAKKTKYELELEEIRKKIASLC